MHVATVQLVIGPLVLPTTRRRGDTTWHGRSVDRFSPCKVRRSQQTGRVHSARQVIAERCSYARRLRHLARQSRPPALRAKQHKWCRPLGPEPPRPPPWPRLRRVPLQFSQHWPFGAYPRAGRIDSLALRALYGPPACNLTRARGRTQEPFRGFRIHGTDTCPREVGAVPCGVA